MNAKFLLNDHGIAYLIHGQPFCLEYKTEGCLFVVVVYNNGSSLIQKVFERFFVLKPNSITYPRPCFFLKPNGKFETVTNYYSPQITVWGIGWGIKKLFSKRLRINFFNPITQTIKTHTPDLPPMPDFGVRSPRMQINQQPVRIKAASQPRLLTKEMNIAQYDDYSTYKANYPRTNTIN